MKKTVILLLVFLVSLPAIGLCQKSKREITIKPDTVSIDSMEYRLIILDPGFDTWLVGKPAMNYYSNDYYRLKNNFYVSEWNFRFRSSVDNVLYDSYIDYDPLIDYGIDINYRLYYFFRYFEETNHVKLLPFSR
jgi:hypothetical protein